MTKNNSWNFDTTFAIGDILYASDAATLSKKAIGSSSDILAVNTGIPAWKTLSAGTYASITNAAGTITLDAATTAKWIVSSDGLNCTHTTIASALTAASSGQTIFVRPGTYTENLTLKAGVNITAYSTDSSFDATGVVKIVGKCTFTAAGTVTISGIELKTNGDYFLEVSGSAASIVNLIECSLNASNNTGINFSSSSSSAKITCITCYADVGTTGIALHTSSSAGAISYVYCQLVTTGPTSTVSNNSAGSSGYYYTLASIPIGCTSTGGITCLYCDINTNDRNITAITVNGSGTNVIRDTSVTSGTASAISIGGNNCALVGCNIGSSNTNAVTGAGTLTLIAACNFTSSSKYINTTTQTTVGGVQGYAGSGTNNVGMIGERVSSYASGVALTSTVTANITSIALTPGIWDITGICQMTFSVAGQACIVGISATSATVAGNPGDQYTVTSLAVNAGVLYGTVPAWRVQLTANTTYYLVAQSAHSAGNCTAEGRISAVRAG